MADPESPQPKNLDQAKGELLSSSLGKGAKSFGEAIAPAGAHVGQAITDAAKTASGLIRIGLAPFNVMIWGYEQLEKKFIPKVAEKLESIPIEHRQVPSPEIVGPTLEAAKYRLGDNNISEMFANLIASAADNRVSTRVHPSFVDIIRNLSAYDAKLLTFLNEISVGSLIAFQYMHFHGKSNNANYTQIISILVSEFGYKTPKEFGEVEQSVDNMVRLGLLSKSKQEHMIDRKSYEKLKNNFCIKAMTDAISNSAGMASLLEGVLRFTSFGASFVQACTTPKSGPPPSPP